MLKRWLFLQDITTPLRFVDRYLSDDLAANHAPLPFRTIDPSWDEESRNRAAQDNARSAEYNTEWARVEASRSGDWFGPTRWAVGDADAIEADERAEHPPAAIMAFMAAPHEATDLFVHACDRELALAHLARARSMSLEEIARLPTGAEQQTAVASMWESFGAYWSALNVHPYGWARYRTACEREWGEFSPRFWETLGADPFYPHYEDAPALGKLPFRGITPSEAPAGRMWLFMRRPTPLPAASIGIVGLGEPDQAVGPSGVGSIRRPVATRWEPIGYFWTPGRWRVMAYDRVYRGFHGDVNRRTAQEVRFTTPDETTLEQISRIDCATRRTLVGCQAGDAHTLWLKNDGTVWSDFRHDGFTLTDCVPRSIRERVGDTVGSDLAPALPGGWCCGYGYVHNPWLGPGLICYKPPAIWYAQLLQPLLDYLATRDPLEVVHEVRMDVFGRNSWALIASGLQNAGSDAQAILGTKTALSGIREVRQAMGATQVGLGMAAGMATLFNPIAGAIVGVAAAVLELLGNTHPSRIGASIDIFGRFEPSFDLFAINSSTSLAEVRRSMPVSPPGYDSAREAPVERHEQPRQVFPVFDLVVPTTNPQSPGAVEQASGGMTTGTIGALATVSAAATAAVLFRREIAALLRRPFRRSRR